MNTYLKILINTYIKTLTFHLYSDCFGAGTKLISGTTVIDASVASVDLFLFFYIMSDVIFAANH